MNGLNTLVAQTDTVIHRFARLRSLTEWWEWLLLALVCIVIAAYSIWMIRRDSVELPRALAIVLTLLRLTAFAGILFYFFKLERRFESEETKNSRALVLVDTSLSMTIRDEGSVSPGSGLPRIENVVNALKDGALVRDLQKKHDVVVYRFDQEEKPVEVSTFRKVIPPEEQASAASITERAIPEIKRLMIAFAVLLAVGLIAGLAYLVVPGSRREDTTAWSLLICMVALIASAIVFATASLRDPNISLLSMLGLSKFEQTASEPQDKPAETKVVLPSDVSWSEELAPRGIETRLGDALRSLLAEERGGTAAGVILMTDGNRNAGVDLSAVIPIARDANIPVYAIGLGSDVLPINARVVDFEAPQRVYLGDKFTLTGHLMATGQPKATLNLQLFSATAATSDEKPVEVLEEEKTIEVTDGQLATVRFEVEPEEEHVGKRDYILRAKPIDREVDLSDNQRSARVDVVDRKDKILLFAGGPTRDFIFLRNLLYRDEKQGAHVTVLLQSAEPGISQEADEIIYEFPQTADELFEYDAIVAFDPDWDALDELQVELLERWVGEKAGGLIVVAGPVFTPQWSTRRDTGKLRDVKKLYPVVFYSPAASIGLARFGSDKPWPVEFSRQGREAPFLWLGDDSIASERAWNSLDGTYGYYAVKDPKAGATVYARFADPDARIDDEFPIYMAGQFYGAGRVFFLASGEAWRMRSIDEAYFDEFYTKLIRWTAEGRLLRDSSRGLLLVDKERCFLGDRVTIRATLQDRQHQPLTQAEITAQLVLPNGRRSPITLKKLKDSEREGIYTEQFTAALDGDYRIELAPPSSEGELLVKEVRVRIPEGELQNPKRNDPLLLDLTSKTGGKYFVGINSALVRNAEGSAIVEELEPRDQITVREGTPDKKFEERLMGWLIGLIAGVLCVEWLLRRLNKLA